MPRTAVDVDLRARDRTRAAFVSAQRGLDGLIGRGGRLAGLFSRAGPIGAGVASVGIAAGLVVKALVDVVDELDEIDKASKRVGVSAEELQSLRLAAQLGGAEIRQTDIALQRFSRRIGEVAKGTGELLPTFERMNIQVRNVDGSMRSNVDILDEYVRKVREMGSTQEQTAAIFKAFDSEGVRFGRALVENELRVRELTDAFREQGLVISERYVRQAADAKDAMTLLNAQWKVAVSELLIQFLPALQATIPALRDLATHVVSTANAIADMFDTRPNEALLDEIEELTGKLLTLERIANREGFTPSAERLAEIEALRAKLAELIARLNEAREKANETVLAQAAALGGADPTIRELAEAALRAEEKNRNVQREILEMKLARNLIGKEEYELALRRLEGAKQAAAVEKTVEELARERLDAARKEELIQAAMNKILAERASILFNIGELTREQIERLKEVFGAGKDSNEQDDEAISKKERILELAQGLADVLAGFTDSTEGWLRALGQVFRLWQSFEFGGESPGGVTGAADAAGRVFFPRTPVGTPAGATVTNNLIFQGTDYGADFRARVDADAPYILDRLSGALLP